MTLPEATALADEAALADYTQATTIFADNRENVPPTVDPQAFTAIQQATEDELLKMCQRLTIMKQAVNGQKKSSTSQLLASLF